jgi:hypothetical protein
MKKLLYTIGGFILLLVLLAIGGILYLKMAYPPDIPAEDIGIEPTPERLARGEYLTKNVSLCLDCHSPKNYDYFSAPIIPGSEGKGGEVFPGVPGTLYMSNITPAALKNWSDGEIARAIVNGIGKNNRPLAPMMPYSEYRYMAKEDVYAIIAYLRTLPPLENENPIPETEIDFPLNLIFRTLPGEADPQPLPDTSDAAASGKYYARIAGCVFCHTPAVQGAPIAGMDFAGGHEFADPPSGTVRSANLTPDTETGIGSWTKEAFINRFKMYADSAGQRIPVSQTGFQTVMPWTLLAGMREEDLGAIYEYLRTVAPVRNPVEKFTPALTQ